MTFKQLLEHGTLNESSAVDYAQDNVDAANTTDDGNQIKSMIKILNIKK